MEDRKYFKLTRLTISLNQFGIKKGDIFVQEGIMSYFPRRKKKFFIWNDQKEEITKKEYEEKLWGTK